MRCLFLRRLPSNVFPRLRALLYPANEGHWSVMLFLLCLGRSRLAIGIGQMAGSLELPMPRIFTRPVHSSTLRVVAPRKNPAELHDKLAPLERKRQLRYLMFYDARTQSTNRSTPRIETASLEELNLCGD